MGINRIDPQGRIVGPDGWAFVSFASRKERKKCKRCGNRMEAWYVARPKGRDEAAKLKTLCLYCWKRRN